MERVLFARMPVWAALLIAALALGLGGAWAYGVLRHDVFPAALLKQYRAFLRGVPGDDRPVWLRLASQFAYSPRAFPASSDTTVLPATAFVPVTAAADAPAALLPEIAGMRVANPGGTTRYFVVFGSFAFPGQKTSIGAIALDSTGVIHRAWPERVEGGEYLGPHIGLAVSPGGVVATNARGILTAQDWCGRPLWQAPWSPPADGIRRDENGLDGYDWHHDISYHDGAFWTYEGPQIAEVEVADGTVRRRIHAVELMRWSWAQGLDLMGGGTGLFNPARLNAETAVDLLPPDPFHFNKVAVLDAALAPRYPGLQAGDLLITVRNQNLVAVIRPAEERFVWWRLGLTSRPHDASFVDGAVEVFDNAPFVTPPAPSIRRLDFARHEFETVFDLSRFGFRMRQRGNFERDGDRLLVVDDEAGRMIATRLDGTIEVVFENGHDDGESEINLQLRNATEIAPERFARLQAQCG